MADLVRIQYVPAPNMGTKKVYWYKCEWCGADCTRAMKMPDFKIILCDPCREKRTKEMQEAYRRSHRRTPHDRKKKVGKPPVIRSKRYTGDNDYIASKCCYCGKEFNRTKEWVYKIYANHWNFNYACSYNCLQAYRRKWEINIEAEKVYEA